MTPDGTENITGRVEKISTPIFSNRLVIVETKI